MCVDLPNSCTVTVFINVVKELSKWHWKLHWPKRVELDWLLRTDSVRTHFTKIFIINESILVLVSMALGLKCRWIERVRGKEKEREIVTPIWLNLCSRESTPHGLPGSWQDKPIWLASAMLQVYNHNKYKNLQNTPPKRQLTTQTFHLEPKKKEKEDLYSPKVFRVNSGELSGRLPGVTMCTLGASIPDWGYSGRREEVRGAEERTRNQMLSAASRER